MPMKPRHLLLIALLLVAFWLRINRLADFPTGLSADEAVNAIDAFTISQTGNYPLYEDFGRPEPVFRLAQALGVLLYGASVWAVRLTSAFVGVLTLAAAYWAVRQCTFDLPFNARWVGGCAAAASLATSLGHITLSRSTYRGLPQPLLMFLFTGLLLRGLRTGKRRDLILAGVMLAVAIYTYTAAFILPVSLGAVGLCLLLFQTKKWRTWMLQLILVGVVTVALLIPVGLRYLDNPAAVLGRSADVGAGNTDLRAMVNTIIEQLFTAGDENPQYNVAFAPLIPPPFQALFGLGLLMLLVRLRQPSSWLLAAFLVLAAIPVVLTEEWTHGLRIIGEFGMFPLVIGVGVGQALAWIMQITEKHLPRPQLQRWLTTGAALLLAGVTVTATVQAQQTYTAYWAGEKHHSLTMYNERFKAAEWFFRPDLRDLGRWVAAQETPILMPVTLLNRAEFLAWLLADYPNVDTAQDITLPADTQILIPWMLRLEGLDDATRHYALLHDSTVTLLPPLTAEAHATLLADLDNAEALTRTGVVAEIGRVFPALTDTLAFEPRQPIATDPIAIFADDLALLGWRGPDTLVVDGGPTVITLDWASVQRRLGHNYTTFLQLWTAEGAPVANDEWHTWRWLYPTTIWQANEPVPVPYTLDIPPDLPPGAYQLVAGAYVTVDERLPAVSAPGDLLGDTARVGWLKVPQTETPQPITPTTDIVLDDQIALLAAQATPQTDDTIVLTLDWQTTVHRPNLDATIFVHATGPDGNLIAQDDQRPQNGQYPTFIWDAGEIVRTVHTFVVGDTPPEDVHLFVGMYTQPDFTRLPVTIDDQPVPEDRIPLGTLADVLDNAGSTP
ncbi:glycosyltransferase family 39 protein [Chloroflexota bacterium]